MTIPSPLDADSDDATSEIDGDGDGRETTYNSMRYHRPRNGGKERQTPKRFMRDRRLKVLGLEDDDDACSRCLNQDLALNPNHGLSYHGERITSRFFEMHLGVAYKSHDHWTSELRTRAGIPYLGDHANASPLTMIDRHSSKAVTKFLIESGHPEAAAWKLTFPTYHFEIAPSTGDWFSPFAWNSKSLERVSQINVTAPFLPTSFSVPTFELSTC